MLYFVFFEICPGFQRFSQITNAFPQLVQLKAPRFRKLADELLHEALTLPIFFLATRLSWNRVSTKFLCENCREAINRPTPAFVSGIYTVQKLQRSIVERLICGYSLRCNPLPTESIQDAEMVLTCPCHSCGLASDQCCRKLNR